MGNSNKPNKSIVLLAALIQLVNALDFMMIMPLGPDLSKALHISPTYIGYLSGGYTLAAALSSLLCAKFIDRFDRKVVTLIALAGLSFSTYLCTFAWNMESLFLTRIAAGMFAGPATSIALAIVIDAVPVQHRGRAIALVMGVFSIAAIAGVPLGLELALICGWNTPFYVVSGLGVCVLIAVVFLLPTMSAHLAGESPAFSFLTVLKKPVVLTAFLAIGTAIFSTFLIVPNIATYFQLNLQVPRESMSYYYILGGVFCLFAMQLGGRFVDKFGALRVTLFVSVLTLLVVWDGFIHAPIMPEIVIFTLFMAVTATRTIAAATVNSRVPEPWERAGFMSLQSVCQHVFSGLAAVLSSLILTHEEGKLGNMADLAWLTLGLTLVQPVFLFMLLKRLPPSPTPVNEPQTE